MLMMCLLREKIQAPFFSENFAICDTLVGETESCRAQIVSKLCLFVMFFFSFLFFGINWKHAAHKRLRHFLALLVFNLSEFENQFAHLAIYACSSSFRDDVLPKVYLFY